MFAYILGTIIVAAIGFFLFVYGTKRRRQERQRERFKTWERSMNKPQKKSH